ncbi:hypothetical protein BDW62DRAFT_201429 [Aspergillus aurantiobrunneus]
MSITGLRIILKSGYEYGGECVENFQRPFLVSKGHELVGLVGQIENGIIVRLGIVECQRQEKHTIRHDKETSSRSSPLNDLLWYRYETCSIRGLSEPRLRGSLWLSPNARVLPLTRTEAYTREGLVDSDLVPYHVFRWAKSPEDLKDVGTIAACVTSSGDVVSFEFHFQDLSTSHCELELLKVAAKRGVYLQPHRFDIDGEGGEYVSEVQISTAYLQRAIRLKTNFGRQVCFGKEDGQEWEIQRAPEGEVLVGLVVAFGLPTGWSAVKGKYILGKLSSATSLSERLTQNSMYSIDEVSKSQLR